MTERIKQKSLEEVKEYLEEVFAFKTSLRPVDFGYLYVLYHHGKPYFSLKWHPSLPEDSAKLDRYGLLIAKSDSAIPYYTSPIHGITMVEVVREIARYFPKRKVGQQSLF